VPHAELARELLDQLREDHVRGAGPDLEQVAMLPNEMAMLENRVKALREEFHHGQRDLLGLFVEWLTRETDEQTERPPRLLEDRPAHVALHAELAQQRVAREELRDVPAKDAGPPLQHIHAGRVREVVLEVRHAALGTLGHVSPRHRPVFAGAAREQGIIQAAGAAQQRAALLEIDRARGRREPAKRELWISRGQRRQRLQRAGETVRGQRGRGSLGHGASDEAGHRWAERSERF
jgi:hypothetical protein